MSYTPPAETSKNSNSTESWNRWINQRSTIFMSTKEWFNREIRDKDKIDLNTFRK